MSVIQTIRNKYGKIAGAVIAIALVGFIVSDARNGSFGNFFGGHDTNIMKVDGVKVDPKVYHERRAEFQAIYGKGRTLDEATTAQMDEQVLQLIAYETVIGEQCDKLGIQTSDEEKKELIYGPNVAREVHDFTFGGQQVFVNPQTGQFDPGYVKYLEKELQTEPEKIPQADKLREQWEAVKNYVIRTNRINKFNSLFAGSVYEPLYLAKRAFADQNTKASIRYVKVPYTSIPDNQVKVTDNDLTAYMQKHPGIFQLDQPTMSIEYVSFDIIPSSADTARALSALNDIKNDFATAKNNETFVNSKSDEANSYNEGYLNKTTFQSHYADTIMSQPVNSIYGPYYENGAYHLTKITDKKVYPDSVKSRYILVVSRSKTNEILPDSSAKMRIDSAIAAIKAGAPFDSVVRKYSDDDKSKGGENTFTLLQKGALPKQLGNFLFDGKTGETKVIRDSNENFSGYFYAEILSQSGVGPAIQLASISKTLAPSDSTVNAIFAKANEFAGKNPTGPEFEAAIQKQNLGKRVADNIKMSSFTINGLGAAREIVKWTYDHKPGDVSSVFQLGDQRYVVAKVSGAQDKGMMAITPSIRPQLEQRVREEMKADIIAKKYKGVSSLDAVAKTENVQVQQNDSVLLNASYIPNVGYEPEVIGYTFYSGFQPNTVSPGIKGQGGVYFITVLNRATPPQMDLNNPNLLRMLSSQSMMKEMQERNTIGQSLLQTVMKKADIKYYYTNF
jgi:hypothetical protein